MALTADERAIVSAVVRAEEMGDDPHTAALEPSLHWKRIVIAFTSRCGALPTRATSTLPSTMVTDDSSQHTFGDPYRRASISPERTAKPKS